MSPFPFRNAPKISVPHSAKRSQWRKLELAMKFINISKQSVENSRKLNVNVINILECKLRRGKKSEWKKKKEKKKERERKREVRCHTFLVKRSIIFVMASVLSLPLNLLYLSTASDCHRPILNWVEYGNSSDREAISTTRPARNEYWLKVLLGK